MMLVVTAAGCVFFPGLFLLSTRTLTHLMGWSHQEAAVVSTRLVSAVQAAMASVVGCVIVASCRDVVMDSHWLTDAYIFFATPYFAYDIYAMFLCSRYRLQVKGHDGQVIRGQGGAEIPPVSSGGAVGTFLRQELLLVLHHVFVVTFCFPASVVWRRGQGDFFQGLLFLAELSTPSVCLGKVLLQCCVKASSPVSTGGRCCSVFVSQFQKQNSLLYRLNGAALLLTFFCCRVLLFPFLYYSYSRYASISLLSVPLVAPWQCNLGMALLWPLQLYWFALLCRKALRQPTASKSTHAD